MKTILIVGLIFSRSCFAQLLVTTSPADAQGRVTVSFQNTSNRPLTAVAITWIVPHASGPGHEGWLVYKDALIEGNFLPVTPGSSSKLTVGGEKLQVVEAKVQAGVFDDGSGFGDSQWIQMITARRGRYVEAMNYVLTDLAEKIANTSDSRTAIQELQISQQARIAAIPINNYQLRQLFLEPTQDIKDANLAALAIKDQVGCIRVAYGRVLHSLPKSPSVQHIVELFTSEYSKQKALLLASKPAIAP
jgi:hypothetical protein